ncbi:hypothetical protein CWI42_050640 [Ordospora colligata]|nr:hypothetical protein CWI42_050640 [Ordospora colligata]
MNKKYIYERFSKRMNLLYRCGALLMIANSAMSSTGSHPRIIGWDVQHKCTEFEDMTANFNKAIQKLNAHAEHVKSGGVENIGECLEEIKSYDGDPKKYEAKVMGNEVKLITVHDDRYTTSCDYKNRLHVCVMMDIGDLNVGYSLPYECMGNTAMKKIRLIYNDKRTKFRDIPYSVFKNYWCKFNSGYGVLRFDSIVNTDELFENMSVLLSVFNDNIDKLNVENPETQSLSSVLKRWNEEYHCYYEPNPEEVDFVWSKLVSMSDITIVAIGNITEEVKNTLNGMALAIRSSKYNRDEEEAELLKPNVCTHPYNIYTDEYVPGLPFIHISQGFYSDQRYVIYKGSGEGNVEKILPIVLEFFQSFMKSKINEDECSCWLEKIGGLNVHFFPISREDPDSARIIVSQCNNNWMSYNDQYWGLQREEFKKAFEALMNHIDFICAMEPADRKKYFVESCDLRLSASDRHNESSHYEGFQKMKQLVLGSFNYPSKDYLRHGVDDLTDEEIMDVMQKLRKPESWSLKGA